MGASSNPLSALLGALPSAKKQAGQETGDFGWLHCYPCPPPPTLCPPPPQPLPPSALPMGQACAKEESKGINHSTAEEASKIIRQVRAPGQLGGGFMEELSSSAFG